ncbi:MAG: outer membrane protein assembly factor BamB family protein [Gemmataceae bacterium]
MLRACLLTFSLTGFVRADNWPQWRGPTGDGISKETNLPTHWNATDSVAWSLPLPGQGSSTPAVWGERIFLTSADNNNDLWLLCVSTSGKELWRRKLGNARFRTPGGEGNGASSSPSSDGKHVWAFAGSGELGCFDLDGKETWKFNAQERYGKFDIQYGMHTTPLLYGARLYLQLIHSGGAWVIALDKNSGETVWKVERQSDGVAECEQSYASPCIWHKGDKAYLITHGNDYAIAHRLDNGAEIWRVGDLNPKDHYNKFFRFVASPVAATDLIVVPSAKKGPVVGVEPSAAGMVRAGSPGEKWRMKHNTPDVSSPLVHDGLVYLCREDGVLICLDAKSGEQVYSESLHKQRYRASPVYADGKIYLTARDGVVSVVKAGRKFELLAVNRMGDDIAASPAIADGRIYLRGFKALYAIGERK